MNDPSASSVLNAIVEEFGDNALFALELYTQYRFEPGSVGENWKRAFQEMEERVPHALSPSARLRSPAPGPLPAPAAPGSTAAVSPAPPATRPPVPGPRAGRGREDASRGERARRQRSNRAQPGPAKVRARASGAWRTGTARAGRALPS